MAYLNTNVNPPESEYENKFTLNGFDSSAGYFQQRFESVYPSGEA